MIQAVIFNKALFTQSQCRLFLDQHHLHAIKPVHITKNYLRYRIEEPIFKHYNTTGSTTPGVFFINGHN
jgi:hypothetical protein